MSRALLLGQGLRWALGLTLLATAVLAAVPDGKVAESAPTPTAGSRARTDAAPGAGPAARGWPDGPRARGLTIWPAPEGSSTAAWGRVPQPLPQAKALAARPAVVAEPAIPLPAPEAEREEPPPYTLIGRIDDGAEPHALLLGAQHTLAVQRGDTVDARWRVEAVQSTSVTLSSLRSGQRLILSFKPA